VIVTVIRLTHMQLPPFRYHPDPFASGAVERERIKCVCCKKTVEHAYVASAYSTHDLDGKLCLWCIADGTANEKLTLNSQILIRYAKLALTNQ